MGPPLDEELNPIAFPILHVLPPLVVRTLQKHFYAGVKAAEMRFKYNAADEDSLTGALGERLTEPKPIVIRSGNDVFEWRTEAYKIRGRGPGAPEHKLGADGIFQLEVIDQQGNFIVRKGLVFQSKKEWTGTDRRLLGQTQDLLAQSPSAIIVDFSKNGYKAFTGQAVVAAGGVRRKIKPQDNKPLAEVLGDEFVGCLRGDNGLYWQPELERLTIGSERFADLPPKEYIGNTIRRLN
jgi:hypothetical protein